MTVLYRGLWRAAILNPGQPPAPLTAPSVKKVCLEDCPYLATLPLNTGYKIHASVNQCGSFMTWMGGFSPSIHHTVEFMLNVCI